MKYILCFVAALILLPGSVYAQRMCLLKNATLIVGREKRVLRNASILIEGKYISHVYIGCVDEGIGFDTIIDLQGKYIIPGLIDSHTHLSGRSVSNKALQKALGYGITAVRDMGGDGQYLKMLREDIDSGLMPGPDIYFSALVAGPEFIKTDRRAIQSTPSAYKLGQAPGMRAVSDTTDLNQLMCESMQLGASGIKVYSHLTNTLIDSITQKAHEHGLKAWAHGIVPPATLEEVVDAGVNSVSHVNFFLMPDGWQLKQHGSMAIDPEQLETDRLNRIFMVMKENGTFLDPTLTLCFRMAKMKIKDSLDYVNYIDANILVLSKAYQQGIDIVAGTDIFLDDHEGYIPEIHEEMKLYSHRVGMDNYDVLLTATLNGAKLLGIDSLYGTIEEGKVANMLVLHADPLENIDNTKNIFMVIKNGCLIKNEEK